MVADGPPGVGVRYRSFITGSGWGPWCANGQVSGAPGDEIEAVQVQMTYSP
jgi:hypothetical protein